MHQFRQHPDKPAVPVTPGLRLFKRRISCKNLLRRRPLQLEAFGNLTGCHMRLRQFFCCITKEKARVADIDLVRFKDISAPLYDFSSTSSLQLNWDTLPFTVTRHMTGTSPFFLGALRLR